MDNNHGQPLRDWNFPQAYSQHSVTPPAPYLSPDEYYQRYLWNPPFDPLESPVPSLPPTLKRAPSTDRGEPAKRGRPRGSGKKGKSATTKAAKEKAPAKQKRAVDEDIPIEFSDSDDDIEKTLDGRVRHWTDDEKTTVFSFILGQDAEGDKRFEQHKKNPQHVYRRASDLAFDGSRSWESIKSLFTRSLDTFTWMLSFDSFTGNGGGDPDSDDPTAILKGKLTAARRAGLQLGSLKPATITKWNDNGWFDLFNDRLGTSSKVSREVVINSASAISDIEDTVDAEGDSDANITPAAPRAVPPKTPSASVVEPKHTPSSGFRKQASNSFGHLGEFMKMKVLSEEKRASAMDAKLQLEREKLELDKAKGKVEMAANVLKMDGASNQVKDAANAYLLSLFSD